MIVFAFLIAANEISHAKDPDKDKGLFGIIQLSYVPNHEYIQYWWNQAYIYDDLGSHVRSLNFIMGYYILPSRLSLGAGFGLDGYFNPQHNTAPLYGDLRYYFPKKRNAFYGRLGYGGYLPLGGPITTTGSYFRVGAGYKVFVSKKLCMNFDVSYAPAKIVNDENDYSKVKGIAFSVGFFLF
jgi:hypothetical protein